jgi:hypothetical protein
MVARFQIEGIQSTRGVDLPGEREVEESDAESENEAQNSAGDAEFGDDGEFFEP